MRRFILAFFAFAAVCLGQTTTPNLGLILPAQNATNWGVITNYNMLKLDSAYGAGQVPYQGLWSNSKTYSVGVLVSYSGSLYASNISNNLNNNPISSGQWTNISSAGLPYPSGTGVPCVNAGSSWCTTYNASNKIPSSYLNIPASVTSIDGQTGDFTFTGSVTHTGNNYTFTGGGAVAIPVPISTYSYGSGVLHVTDSSGPGNVCIQTGVPLNGSSAGCQYCPGASSANLDEAYLRSDSTPYTYYNCKTSGWSGPEIPDWSTTQILFTNYNFLSPHATVTNDYPYPGTLYSNTSGSINTGNAACMDVFRAEILGHPFLDRGDYAPITWYNQCGLGDWFNWAGGIGWGSITDAPTELKYVLPAILLYQGTPPHGKLRARNASTTGTWTNYDPTTATATGTASSGSTALTVASGSGTIVQFAQVADTTNPSSLTPDTYVQSISGTNVVLSQNTAAAIAGDTLTFVDTSTPPFRAGYGMCSSSGTLTWTTMPASGAVWINYLLKGNPAGTDVANVILDSVTAGTISSGDASGFNTNHNSYAWGAKRFALTGSGQHTVAVTPTAGNICVFFAVTPNPATWSGLSMPRVVQNLMLPYGNGYNPGFDNNMKLAMATQINQLKYDGLNVVAADLWLTWPESGGNTQYCEHNACAYPNGLFSSVASSPHYTKLGDMFNAWGFLQADGRLPETASLDAGVTFSISSGAPAVPATPDVEARKRGFVSQCIFITQASDGTTNLSFSILLNGSTVTSGTVTHGSSAGTVTTFLPTANSNGLVAVAPGQMWELDISAGTSSWKGSFQCM